MHVGDVNKNEAIRESGRNRVVAKTFYDFFRRDRKLVLFRVNLKNKRTILEIA